MAYDIGVRKLEERVAELEAKLAFIREAIRSQYPMLTDSGLWAVLQEGVDSEE